MIFQWIFLAGMAVILLIAVYGLIEALCRGDVQDLRTAAVLGAVAPAWPIVLTLLLVVLAVVKTRDWRKKNGSPRHRPMGTRSLTTTPQPR